MPYHSVRDDPSVDVDTIRILFKHGADPNQPVRLNELGLGTLLSIKRDSASASSTYRSPV
ncbi:hypothetical protein F4860DRAFT_461162 [Xylaria cubensis]|nr:hypothetical protein F4860DRAFT_461162 [Xylaria cubensis]